MYDALREAGGKSGYTGMMTAIPLGDARDHLSEYVADVQRTHNRVTITRYGRLAAVLLVIPTTHWPTL